MLAIDRREDYTEPEFTVSYEDGNVIRRAYHRSLKPHLRFFTEDYPDKITDQIITVYHKEPNWVAAVHLSFDQSPSSKVVIKRFGVRSFLHRLLQPISESGAFRAFRMALATLDAGIKTPNPLFVMDVRRNRFLKQCFLITAQVHNAKSAREILRAYTGESNRLQVFLKSIAITVRRLHDAGIMHRDLTLGNFLTSEESPNDIYLIDLSRSIKFPSLPVILRLIDLARINLGPHWPSFYKHYCKDRPSWQRYEWLLYNFVRLRRISLTIRKMFKRKLP